MEPLAYTLRPKQLNDIVGQTHLVGTNGPIRKMVEKSKVSSMILYGPPGIGKTTIATVISNELEAFCMTFNASTDNKAQLKENIQAASNFPKSILIIDEIHRMKTDIQDYLLPFVERGDITLIGLTTINPYHSINPAIRSRCVIFKLNTLTENDLEKVIVRAIKTLDEKITIGVEAKQYLIQIANGEVRTLINNIELIYNTLDSSSSDTLEITLEAAQRMITKPSATIDKNADSFYDTLSGLHKSIRGSDVNASLHYLGKLLFAEDLLPIIRRLYAITYEDISIANPSMGPKVRAACEAALELGMPEAKLPLASIVVDMALSPKSNSTYLALTAAMEDIENGKIGELPLHLKNIPSFDPNQTEYLYPHDFPGSWVDQQYLPNILKEREYFKPKSNSKYEDALKIRYEMIQKAKKK